MFGFFRTLQNKLLSSAVIVDSHAFSASSFSAAEAPSNGFKAPETKSDFSEAPVLDVKKEAVLTNPAAKEYTEKNPSSVVVMEKETIHQQSKEGDVATATESRSAPIYCDNVSESLANRAEPVVIEVKTIDNIQPVNPQNGFIVPDYEGQICVAISEFTQNDVDLVKDMLVAARAGYFDYSVLRKYGYVDSNGYVKDSDALFDSHLLQAGFWGKNASASYFSDEEISWGKENFEIIRVLEGKNSWFQLPFEVNLSLLQDKQSGDYIISLAGTNSLSISDWLTNLGNILGKETNYFKKETQLIDKLFKDDIEDGADVDLVGHSLGGREALLQYNKTPDRYDDIYVLQPHLGGLKGIENADDYWNGKASEKITAIMSDEEGFDFNELVTYGGKLPADKVYDLTQNDGNNDGFWDNFVESHGLSDMWDAVSGVSFV